MINVNMTDKAGVTLATAGKYCADNVKVTPSAEILRKDEQVKTATPTETAQDITPDSGKVLSKVSVGAIPKTYVGSGVTKKAAATVSPSTSEQTVCASGVYTTGAQKVSAITPSIVGNLDASSFASSIVAAVESKGVDVPSGAKIDALAALIESIQAGGGGGCKISAGTFTLAESVRNITVNHGLGVVPNFGLITINTSYSFQKNTLLTYIYIPNYGGYGYYYERSITSGSADKSAHEGLYQTTPIKKYNTGRFVASIFNATADSVMFGYFENNNHDLVLSTKPYLWVLGVIE